MATLCTICGTVSCSCTTTCTTSTTSTGCCTEIIDTLCIKHTNGVLSNIPVAVGDTMSTILTSIDTKFATLAATYDISCLAAETSTAADLNTAVTALITDSCSTVTTTYDTDCLTGTGTTSRTIYLAMSDVITFLCNSNPTYATYDTTCLGIASTTSTLNTTVQGLLTEICAINWTQGLATTALDWSCLTAPADGTLPLALTSLINGIVANQITFGTVFDTTVITCGKTVDLNYSALSQSVLDTIAADAVTLTPAFNDLVKYKVSPDDTCLKNDLGDAIAVTTPLTIEEVTTVDSTFTYSFSITYLEGLFNGVTSGSGLLESPAAPISFTDTASIITFLTGLGYTNVTVTAADPFPATTATVNISIQGQGNNTDFKPVIQYDESTLVPDQSAGNSGYSAIVPTDTCKALRLGLDTTALAASGGPTGLSFATLEANLVSFTSLASLTYYYKDDFNRVHFMGDAIKYTGATLVANSLLFTLGAGFTPMNNATWLPGPLYFTVPIMNNVGAYSPYRYATIRVETAGGVYLEGTSDATNVLNTDDYIDLRSISFLGD